MICSKSSKVLIFTKKEIKQLTFKFGIPALPETGVSLQVGNPTYLLTFEKGISGFETVSKSKELS